MKVLHLSAAAMLAWGGFAAFNVASATTYYVRTDGGTAAQCNGTADKAYPGSGTNLSCAWNHPFVALPPTTSNHPMSPRIHGGDTLVIDPGSYEIGIGAKDATKLYGACTSTYPWDCEMPAIPSGTASNPTRIVGAGWNSGCTSQPELWGSNRVYHVLSLDRSSNVVVACLNLDDHSACIDGDSDTSVACNRTSLPYGPWSDLGIHAQDSSNVTLQDLRIHGFASTAIQAGRLSNWTVNNVKMIGNGRAGWNGDLGGSSGSSNSGNLNFSNVEIGWTGCTEQYPSTTIYACWGSTTGGYGDSFGSAKTGGNWTFNQVYIHDGTQDGLDLLYADGTGKITVLRSKFVGNAGNQVKLAGPSVIQNSVIVGNCAHFNGQYHMQSGDNCRAQGNALVVRVFPGDLASVSYNTITGQGDCLTQADGNYGDSTSEVDMYNNVLLGQPKWNDGSVKSCLFYWSSPPRGKVAIQNNVIWNTRYYTTNPTGNTYADPRLTSESLSSFNATPLSGSPAIDKASTRITVKTDYAGNARPVGAGYDIGSYEYGSSPTSPTPPPPTSTPRKWKTGGALPARLIGSATSTASAPARSVSSQQTPARKATISPVRAHSTALTDALRRWLDGSGSASR
ncbi:MAG TPA: choice-of-anchor Q domain-containing protein [Rhodanobacteraceae bacterium]|jgi:hypothetical protein